MDLRVIDRREIDAPLAGELAELLCSVWPNVCKTVEHRKSAFLNDWKAYDGPDEQFPRSYIVFDRGSPVAHAGLFPRRVTVGNHAVTVGALEAVCCHAEFRGQGLGVATVKRAFEPVDEGIFDFVLFQNYREYQPFYEKLGAQVIRNRLVNSLADAPDANPFWADVAMVYAGKRPWPVGDVDLRGPGY